MTDVENGKPRERQTPEQFYGIVNAPEESLDDFVPPSTASMLKEVIAVMRAEGASVGTYKVTETGDKDKAQKVREINVRIPDGSPTRELEIELMGEWKGGNKLVPHELIPLRAGRWYRKTSPDAKYPIADVGQELKPGDMLGLIGIGKKAFQPFVLPPGPFPLGARVVGMPLPDKARIIPGKTVVALVVPLK